ncbi:AMP-binding protein [Gordonia sp. NPDC003950]
MRELDDLSATEVIRGWLRNPSHDRGIHLAGEGQEWTFRSYGAIADHAVRIAADVREHGVAGGDGVCVILPTDHTCAAAFYAVWVCGGVLTPIVPPTFADLDQYRSHVAAIIDQARPRLVVTEPGLAGLVREALELSRVRCRLLEVTDDPAPTAGEGADLDEVWGPAGDCALLQFTSGSTGAPRGVRISWESLSTNTAMISELLRWRDGEPMASWLPLYHDMGLVGGFLTTVTNQEDLHLMRPDHFVRDPVRWLRAMTVARHTPSPSFALGYLAHRIGADEIADLDLSGWRTLAVGSEPVEIGDLQSFTELAGPCGFDAEAVTLAYGLAESTLMVCSSRRDAPITLVRPGVGGLRFGYPVDIAETREFSAGATYSGSGWIAGLGCSTARSQVAIVDDAGDTLPAGVLGEVIVTGSSVASGYSDDRAPAAGSTRIIDGVLYTGDAGFLLDDELFVLGRMGSSLKVRGRSVFMEDLESKVSAESGITKGKLAAVAVTDSGDRGVALFAEAPPGEWMSAARTIIRAELGPAHTVTVVTGPRGLIRRTSSGKPRRRHMWQLHIAGALDGAQTHDVDGTSAHPAPTPTLGAQRVTGLLDSALELVTVPDACAVVFEGSLAEGFGNEGSDVDFLVIAAGDDEMPTLPSVLFADGRRLEIRTRSVAQLREQLETVARHTATDSVDELGEDLLNRCQRFLNSTTIRDGAGVDLDELRNILSRERFADTLTSWWADRARQAFRQAVALRVLGCADEALGWAVDALTQAAKCWCAAHGETYLESKWLPRQLDRAAERGDADLIDRYRVLVDDARRTPEPDRAWWARVAEMSTAFGVDADRWCDPAPLRLTRVPGVTTWTVADRIHVIRSGADVVALSDRAAQVWRQVVFRRPLTAVLGGATAAMEESETDESGAGGAVRSRLQSHSQTESHPPSPSVAACIAEFIRLGLVGLDWRGAGPVRPAMTMCEPSPPYTPMPYTPPLGGGRPLVGLTGAARPDTGIAVLSPLPAARFASAALDLTWANVVAENAREDLAGAVKSGQGAVAQVAAHRLIAMSARMMLSSNGIHPLPPDVAPVATLRRLLPDGAGHDALVMRFEAATAVDFPALVDGGDPLAGLETLDDLLGEVRARVGGADFPSSFDSKDQWRATLGIAYDWVRIGTHLGVPLPLAEAGDLVGTGGAQPHTEAQPHTGAQP